MERDGWEDLAYVECIMREELLASPLEPRYIFNLRSGDNHINRT